MPNYSPECQPIASKIKGLQSDISSLQKTLQKAAPGEKAGLIAQIKKFQGQIAQEQGLLDDCVKKHPYHPPPPPPKNPCLSLLKELNNLQLALGAEIQKALAPLQKDLQHATGGEKVALLAQIKAIRADLTKNSPLAKQIAAKQKEYDACLKSHGGLLALDATFKGKATMQTDNDNAPGPYTQDVAIGLNFGDWDHSDVSITDFPAISVTFDTPLGTNTTTVTMISGSGHYDRQGHYLTMNLDLYFHHSLSVAGDSRLDIQLSNTAPMTSDGKISVFGSAPFQGGYLGGNECSFEVHGKIAPHP